MDLQVPGAEAKGKRERSDGVVGATALSPRHLQVHSKLTLSNHSFGNNKQWMRVGANVGGANPQGSMLL